MLMGEVRKLSYRRNRPEHVGDVGDRHEPGPRTEQAASGVHVQPSLRV